SAGSRAGSRTGGRCTTRATTRSAGPGRSTPATASATTPRCPSGNPRGAVLGTRRKVIILMTCCLSLLIVSLDATIVNVALPAIRADLGATPSQLQWVIDIYTVVLAALLLLAGAAADRFGRRRTFQVGLSVFALASLLCSLAPNTETLIAARFLQAVGGSMLN